MVDKRKKKEKDEEVVPTPKKIKKVKEEVIATDDNIEKKKRKKEEQNESPVEEPVKEKKKKAKKESTAESTVSEEVAPKKKNKKNESVVAQSTSEVYTPGALSALFGTASSTTDEAPTEKKKKKMKNEIKDDLFSKYEGTDNGFVDVPTVIVESSVTVEKEEKADASAPASTGEKEKNEKKLNRDKQRLNRKKNGKEEKPKTKVEKGARMDVEEKKRTVFVGNLPSDMNPKELKKIFADCGKIDSVRLRGTVGDRETISKKVAFLARKVNENLKNIIGYVKFVSEESVQEALKKNGTVVREHHLHVDGCIGTKNYDHKHTVFVGNLQFELSDDKLIEWAEENVGKVDFVRIFRDRNTGYGKGTGFIAFKDEESVEKALALVNPKLDNNTLRISKILKKKEKRKLEEAKANGSLKRFEDTAGPPRKQWGGPGAKRRDERPRGPLNPLLAKRKTEKELPKRVKNAIKKRRNQGPKTLMK